MKDERIIPNTVIITVAKELGSHYYSHQRLNHLFSDKRAPGEPPENTTCEDKCKVWFKRVNDDQTIDALDFLGRILFEFMEFDDSQKITPQKAGRDKIINVLAKHGLSYCLGGSIIEANTNSLDANLRVTNGDLFKKQFPLGLPFGLDKPDVAAIPKGGVQQVSFKLGPRMGILKEKVYPNLSFPHLFEMLQNSDTSGVSPDMKTLATNLVEMNQSKYEKEFFCSYARRYQSGIENVPVYAKRFHVKEMENVPVLIPQAWIQWHSQTKQNLRSQGSSYADDPYRVDFVAFWKDQRFVILVDGIEHYANRQNNRWDADEEKYSKRLKEDRKLRKEGWQVCRVSNWEIRNGLIDEILVDLKEFLDF